VEAQTKEGLKQADATKKTAVQADKAKLVQEKIAAKQSATQQKIAAKTQLQTSNN